MPKPDPQRLRRASSTAVVFDAQGRLLLHRRTDNGFWSLPGGAIELGETAAQGVIREVLEETGIVAEVVRLIGIYSDPEFTTVQYPDGEMASYVAILFECRAHGGTPTLCDESSAVDWFDPRNLPEPFLKNHRPRVTDALALAIGAFYR